MPDDLWRTLLEADRASNELPHLAIEVLAAQRQSNLDVSQFTKEEVTQLIELIGSRVRDQKYLIYLAGVQRFTAPSARGYPRPTEEYRFGDSETVLRSIPTTTQILPHRWRTEGQ